MKRRWVTMLLFLPAVIALGQDTTYFDADWNKVSSLEIATYYAIVQLDPADTNRATETFYFTSGQIKTQKNYADFKDKKLDGKVKMWYESGQLQRDIDYTYGKLNGSVLTYWDNGNPKRIDTYENDQFIDGKCFDPDGVEIPHFDYEKRPAFPGGENELIQYLSKNIKYPVKSRKAGIEGRVVVHFVVDKTGNVTDVKMYESLNAELDAEAMRVVQKMPKWEPAMQDGEIVRAAFKLPIAYRLD